MTVNYNDHECDYDCNYNRGFHYDCDYDCDFIVIMTMIVSMIMVNISYIWPKIDKSGSIGDSNLTKDRITNFQDTRS